MLSSDQHIVNVFHSLEITSFNNINRQIDLNIIINNIFPLPTQRNSTDMFGKVKIHKIELKLSVYSINFYRLGIKLLPIKVPEQG